MIYTAEINVMPQKEILDPQGKAVRLGLHNLGIDNITDVRIGKHITLQIEANMLANALFTASDVGKAFWISGWSTTTLLPCIKCFRYLPLTPLPSSSRFNSGMSWSAILIDAFFISCCLSGADDSYAIATFGVDYNQKP